jgi:hypothetical protein
VVIRGSNGAIARTLERPERALEGAPVGTTVLVLGQRAFVFVLWMIGGSAIGLGGKPVIPTRGICGAYVPRGR